MTDQETFYWGDRAEALINNPDYNALFDRIRDTIAQEILSAHISDNKQREELYNVFAGMRSFATYVVAMAYAKELLIKRQDADDEDNQEDSN